MTRGRLDALALTALALLAVVLQVSVLSQVALRGVVPDLALLLVVAVGLSRGARSGAVVGFWAGLLLDVAPPADHVAGAWALVLLTVGLLAGRAASRPRSPVAPERGPVRPVVLTAGLSLGAHVAFAVLAAVTGGAPGDGTVIGFGDGLGTLAQIIVLAVLMDVVAAAVLLGALRSLLGRLPGREDHEEALGLRSDEAAAERAARAGERDAESIVVRATDQATGQLVALTRGETWHRS
ncbi:hypothetical protein GCM10011519_35020 [Marmoricola endophyticus]|uniref:Rod shape-determining protein MreD n=1 Tax=Marmoricola endophyticus TaxID=2040280 RepID=A0A917BTG5_9ACTN|nr:rod shape-determining protein MreD [Marmoricola endophyticus]GGF58134.1 hypothetical protein GCM10011519_35020 [Marmoricola endophyticus]